MAVVGTAGLRARCGPDVVLQSAAMGAPRHGRLQEQKIRTPVLQVVAPAAREANMTIARRKFLAGLAAVGGTTLGKLGGASAQTAPAAKHFTFSKPVIDAHFHWYPPEFVALLEKEGAANGVTNVKRNDNGELECTVPGYHP